MEFSREHIRRLLIDAKLISIFDMSQDDVDYALWSAVFWAEPLTEAQ